MRAPFGKKSTLLIKACKVYIVMLSLLMLLGIIYYVTTGELAEEAANQREPEQITPISLIYPIILSGVGIFLIINDKKRKTTETDNYLNDPDYVNAMNELNKEFPPKNYDEENL